MLAIKDCVRDMSAYVRKVAAVAIPKLYALDAELQPQLIECIDFLLGKNGGKKTKRRAQTKTLFQATNERLFSAAQFTHLNKRVQVRVPSFVRKLRISMYFLDRSDLLHRHFRSLCRVIVDVGEQFASEKKIGYLVNFLD